MKTTKNKKGKAKTWLVVVVVLVLAGGAFAYARTRNAADQPIDQAQNQSEDPGDGSTIDLNPPTDTEKEETEQHKNELPDDSTPQPTPPSSSKKKVTPIITSAGQFDSEYGNQIEVRAFVPGIFEGGGTCTATFTKGGAKLSRKVDALQDATTTRCGVVAIARKDFPGAGTWSVVVAYASSKAAGTSTNSTFKVK